MRDDTVVEPWNAVQLYTASLADRVAKPAVPGQP